MTQPAESQPGSEPPPATGMQSPPAPLFTQTHYRAQPGGPKSWGQASKEPVTRIDLRPLAKAQA